jgi:hypothetical protein
MTNTDIFLAILAMDVNYRQDNGTLLISGQTIDSTTIGNATIVGRPSGVLEVLDLRPHRSWSRTHGAVRGGPRPPAETVSGFRAGEITAPINRGGYYGG